MIDTIETPAIIIDEAVAYANITAFQNYCTQHNLKLRPHIKTHKLPHFAKAQIRSGAVGINCQKIGEAEVMADAGIDDILITFNILGDAKIMRLLTLANRVKKLTVTADNSPTIAALARSFEIAKKPLNVMIECDTGAGRCGVQSADEALLLAKIIKASTGLTFGGLLTYPPVGGAMKVDAFMTEAMALLAVNDILCPEISSGGSPDMWAAKDTHTATEYRTGTYIYNDRSLVERKTCKYEDCALTILATVVSTPTSERAIIDAGSKALTSDLLGLNGFGYIVGHPEAKITSLSEEHGIINCKTDEFAIGDRISIIPNHACVVSNLFDFAWLRTSENEVKKVLISARGRVT